MIIDCAAEFAAADAAVESLTAFASFTEASVAVDSATCCPAWAVAPNSASIAASASRPLLIIDCAAEFAAALAAIELSTVASFSARVPPKSDVVSAL